MDLSFLTPLYERPGPWASVYADTSTVDESTPQRRELHARQACRDLLEQGADEATGYAVYDALASCTHGAAPAAAPSSHGAAKWCWTRRRPPARRLPW